MWATRRSALAAGLSFLATARAAAQSGSTELMQAARLAALYLIPLYRMYGRRWSDTVDEGNPARMPLNRLVHQLVPSDRVAGRAVPNHDVLVSQAWLDLSQEPLFLTLPSIEGRYYDLAIVDMAGRSISLSRRILGARPPPHMIVGPTSAESAQRGLVMLRATGNSLLLQYRLQLRDTADHAAVQALQRRSLLETPDMRNERRMIEMRELIRQRTVLPPEPVADWLPPDPGDPIDLFTIGAQVLAEIDVPVVDPAMAQAFDVLRLKPRRRYDRWNFTAGDRAAILAGIADAWSIARHAAVRFTCSVNGWRWLGGPDNNPDDIRTYRALRAMDLLAAPESGEMIVATCDADSDGQPLSGDRRYVLRLPGSDESLAYAFWSLSAHRLSEAGTLDEVASFTVSEHGPGLGQANHGASEIRLQRTAPPSTPGGRWLGLPDGRIRLVWRLYEPAQAVVAGQIGPPAVIPV